MYSCIITLRQKMGKKISKMYSLYTVEYYSAFRRKAILMYTMCMKLDITLKYTRHTGPVLQGSALLSCPEWANHRGRRMEVSRVREMSWCSGVHGLCVE